MGFAYSLSPRTVVRAGYGIFYSQAFYPGWNGENVQMHVDAGLIRIDDIGRRTAHALVMGVRESPLSPADITSPRR